MSNQYAMAPFLALKCELDYVASIPAAHQRRDRYEQTFAALRAWLAVPPVDRRAILAEEVIQPALRARYASVPSRPLPGLTGATVDPGSWTGGAELAAYSDSEIQDELVQAFYFGLLVDEWNLDEAADVLADGTVFAKLLTRRVRLEVDNGILENIGTFIDRCYALGRPDLCERATAPFDVILSGLRHDEVNVRTLRDRLARALSGTRPRLLLKHGRQRANAARLATRTLPEARTTSPAAGQHKPASATFRRLPQFEPEDQPCPSDTSMIPFPKPFLPANGSYTPEQAWEYHEAFFRAGGAALIDKYLYGRAWALFLSLFLTTEEPTPLLKEAVALAEHFPGKIDRLADWAKFCLALTPEELRERIDVLVQVHKRMVHAPDETSITLDIPDAFWSHEPLMISLSPVYLETAMKPLAALRDILHPSADSAGAADKEEKARLASWRRLSAFLKEQKPQESAIFKADRENDHERVVRLCEDYIGSCMVVASNVQQVEEFQLGYWYDRLTLALRKLDRRHEAKARLETFFALPARYRGRCSRSAQDQLQKRLDRCKKECSVARASVSRPTAD